MYNFQAESKVKLFNSRWLKAEMGNDTRHDHTFYVWLYCVKSKREFILKDKFFVQVGLGDNGIGFKSIIKNPSDGDVKRYIDNTK